MDQRERVGNYEEAITTAFQGMQSELWTALPGIVQSFNTNGDNTCTVQCAISFTQRQPNGTIQTVNMPLLVDCPVIFQGGGGLVMTFSPVAGDECLVVFACRCIDEWWDQGGVQPQLELRLHDLSDGFVIVGPRSKPNAIQTVSPNAQIRSIDGTVYVEVDASGKVIITAPSGLTITGPVSINGKVQIDTSGNITTQGKVTATQEGTFNSIPVSTHTHGGVQSGGSTTGEPIA